MEKKKRSYKLTISGIKKGYKYRFKGYSNNKKRACYKQF